MGLYQLITPEKDEQAKKALQDYLKQKLSKSISQKILCLSFLDA